MQFLVLVNTFINFYHINNWIERLFWLFLLFSDLKNNERKQTWSKTRQWFGKNYQIKCQDLIHVLTPAPRREPHQCQALHVSHVAVTRVIRQKLSHPEFTMIWSSIWRTAKLWSDMALLGFPGEEQRQGVLLFSSPTHTSLMMFSNLTLIYCYNTMFQ